MLFMTVPREIVNSELLYSEDAPSVRYMETSASAIPLYYGIGLFLAQSLAINLTFTFSNG